MAELSETVATLYRHIGRRVVAAKEHTAVHFSAILPLVFEIFVRLSVLSRGTAVTLFTLRKTLEGEYTEAGIPAQSVLEVGFPELSPRDEGNIRTTLWQLVQDLNATNYSSDDIGTACFLSATTTAEKVGGKVLRLGLVKRAIEGLKSEPVFLNGWPPVDTYLSSLPENYADHHGRVDQSLEVTALDDRFANWGPSVVEMADRAYQNRDTFTILAAACFALQLDVQKRFKIDMWRSDDYLQAAIAENAMSPPMEKDLPERLIEAIVTVNALINSNLDASDRFAEGTGPNSKTEELLATFKANAAGVWVLTLLAKIRPTNKQRNSHMRSIWLRLGTVHPELLVGPARMFTGRFIEGISAGTPQLESWPLVKDQGVFLASLIRPKLVTNSPVRKTA